MKPQSFWLLEEVTGREGNQAAGGGALPAPGPSPPLRPGGAGLDPRQTQKERSGRRGVPPPLPQSGAGRRGLPLPPLPRRRPLGSGARRPCPSRALSSLPRPAALSSCRKFQKLSIIPAQRAVRAAKAPRRRATCRPAARPALGPHPVQPGRVATSGRARAKPAAPSRAPGPAECVAAPSGGYFEREGSGPPSVFSAFSWPPARQPGPSAARGMGGGGGGVTWRGEGRAVAIRVGLGLGLGPGTGGARQRSGPALSAGADWQGY